MIITQDDIDEFEAAFEPITRRRYRGNPYPAIFEGREDELELNGWVTEHPQVLMAGAKLQEYVGAHRLSMYKTLVREAIILGVNQAAFREFDGRWVIISCRGEEGIWGYSIDALQYAISKEDADDYEELLDSALIKLPSPDDVITTAHKYVDNPLQDPAVLVSPSLWTPTNQANQKEILQRTAVPLIEAIQAEQCELGSLHWRQLEDIVAEILRNSGMEVHSVRSSPQGGRDIIIRNQLLPGEIITMAVEVKHQAYVDRPILHTALHQNIAFPALMLVTSGRFSAGIIREGNKPENRMRLFLKDGVALRNLIKTYMPRA